MAYEQPRVPIWREEKLTDYIRELVRFLRGFTVAAWQSDKLKDEEIKAIKALIENGAGGGGITVDAVYPVGSVYMSVNETSPAVLFGGTWEQLKDRFLLGAGGSYTVGSTGGSANVELSVDGYALGYPASGGNFVVKTTSVNSYSTNRVIKGLTVESGTTSTATTGIEVEGKATGSHMPPYIAVNIWKRTA